MLSSQVTYSVLLSTRADCCLSSNIFCLITNKNCFFLSCQGTYPIFLLIRAACCLSRAGCDLVKEHILCFCRLKFVAVFKGKPGSFRLKLAELVVVLKPQVNPGQFPTLLYYRNSIWRSLFYFLELPRNWETNQIMEIPDSGSRDESKDGIQDCAKFNFSLRTHETRHGSIISSKEKWSECYNWGEYDHLVKDC